MARDSMSNGDMADELPQKVDRVKKRKAAVDKRERGVPAGAQTGALGNAPAEKVSPALKRIFRGKGGRPGGDSGYPRGG